MTIGLRDLFRAPITVNAQGKEEYGTPVRMAKAISADISIEIAEAILYADDGIDHIERVFVGGELKLNVNDLPPTEVATIFGQTTDDDGVIYAGENDEAPYFAIGFRARKPGGNYRYIWLYKVKFSLPNDGFKTKEGTIEFNTPEITGKIIKRDDGYWKADHVCKPDDPIAEDWFKNVREKNVA